MISWNRELENYIKKIKIKMRRGLNRFKNWEQQRSFFLIPDVIDGKAFERNEVILHPGLADHMTHGRVTPSAGP